jgi:hypothetical protein
MASNVPGTVYLLHFSAPYPRDARAGVQHYLGWADDVERRLSEHLAGRGSPLVAAAVAAGLGVELVATWPGTRNDERARKRRRRHSTWCPRCRAAGEPGEPVERES